MLHADVRSSIYQIHIVFAWFWAKNEPIWGEGACRANHYTTDVV